MGGYASEKATFPHFEFQIQKILQIYGWQLGFGAFVLWIVYRLYRSKKDQLNLPTAGIEPGLLGPWKAGIDFFNHAEKILHEGYNKYSPTGTPFILATFPRYVVVLTDPEHIEELRTAPESELSFNQALDARIRISMTIDPSIVDGKTDYHLDVIRQSITQRLTTVLPEVYDEVDCAWKEIAKVGDDWTRVPAWSVLSQVTARASNRLFVGVGLCRNKEFIDIMLNFAMRVAVSGFAADHLPFFLRHAIVWLILKRYRYQERAEKMLGPIFDERRRKRRELGDEKWDAEKPKDIIQWLLDASASGPKKYQTNTQLTFRILTLNFVAIHTSSLSITHVLYDLAAHPEYIEPLREEIISVLDTHGGYNKLKQSLAMMKKLDSVLRESQRCNGTSSIVMNRMVLRDYTFKSGRQPLTLPKGTMLTVPATAVHRSTAIYGDDASEWKGFRFSDMREANPEAASRYQMVSTSNGYVTFGHGKHACPGRFVATNELKIILSYLILRYDFRLPEEWKGQRPPNGFTFGSVRANTKADLEFRPREQWKELENRWQMPWNINPEEI